MSYVKQQWGRARVNSVTTFDLVDRNGSAVHINSCVGKLLLTPLFETADTYTAPN
jgi:hypothetical protein